NGACALSCSGGLTACGGVCVDTKADDRNCGACGNSCGPVDGFSSRCCGGTCCAIQGHPGVACCGGVTCAYLIHDAQNCGSCGNACPAGQICSGAACCSPTGATCLPGDQCCLGPCVVAPFHALGHCP